MTRHAQALLIVDMINLFDYADGGRLARRTAPIIGSIQALRERYDAAGAPVVYVNDNFSQWQGDFADLVARCARAGGVPARIAAALAPKRSHYHILKPKHSGFLCTALPILLAKLGTRQLAITGIAADSCVLATAQDANMREFGLWVPADCVASRTDAGTTAALSLVRGALGGATTRTVRCSGLFPD